jgi:carbonic anhydrase
MKFVAWFSLMFITSLASAQTLPWSYNAPNGPFQWGALPGFGACQTGADQSPIAIETGRSAGITNVTPDSTLEPIIPSWKPSAFNVLYNGHTVEMMYDQGSTVDFKNQTWNLKQFHFHSPSEHLLNEKQHPLEMHFVHSVGTQTLVIAVFFREGRRNKSLDLIWKNAPANAADTASNIPGLLINAEDFFPRHSKYFNYTGSLTTPPCTEGVTWVVLAHPIEASAEQLSYLQKKLGGPNNRPIQPVDGRMIGAEMDL